METSSTEQDTPGIELATEGTPWSFLDPRSSIVEDVELELGAAHELNDARRASLVDLRREAAAMHPRGSSSATDSAAAVHAAAVREARDPDERHPDDVADGVAPGDSPAVAALERAPVTRNATRVQQQHAKANLASLRSLESTMALGAKQLQAAADQLARLIVSRRPDFPPRTNVAVLNWCVSVASGHLHMVVSALPDQDERGSTAEYLQLAPQLAALTQAWRHFATAFERAQQYASRHLLSLRPSCDAKVELQGVYRKLGFERWPLPAREVDARSELQLLHHAIRDLLNAAYETAHAVRNELAQGAEHVVEGDIRRVLRHVNHVPLLEDQLNQWRDSDSRGGTMHRAHAQRASAELLSFAGEIALHPTLRGLVSDTPFSANLRAIERMAGR